jgi:hypothetical protein
LISFGIDQAALYRLAASYVDRILKGEKSADLPVQAPTKYETVLNIKTAKALGVEVPPSVFARADDLIECSYCCTCSRRFMAHRDQFHIGTLTSAFGVKRKGRRT